MRLAYFQAMGFSPDLQDIYYACFPTSETYTVQDY